MIRWRFDDDGRRTLFRPHLYGANNNHYYKVEIRVETLAEVRRLYVDNPNMSLRMSGQPEGRLQQRSTINANQIEGLGLEARHYENLMLRMEAQNNNEDN